MAVHLEGYPLNSRASNRHKLFGNSHSISYTTSALVGETHLSPNTTLSRFRQMTGLPPHAFLMKCRIHRAKELLARGEKDITAIATELRFSSSQHFATRFRQETGLTPKAWREAQIDLVHKNAK